MFFNTFLRKVMKTCMFFKLFSAPERGLWKQNLKKPKVFEGLASKS